MTKTTSKLTSIEQAMTWERMSGECLSDAERKRIMAGGEFIPPHLQTTECPHCGIDIEDACGHPAFPAPCWSEEAQERFRAHLTTEDRPPHPLVMDQETRLFRYATHADIRRWEHLELQYNNLLAILKELSNAK